MARKNDFGDKMNTTNRTNLRLFFILTYVLFYLLLAITGAMISFNVSPVLVTVMKNVCAWTSTFILLILFRKIFPNVSFSAFLKQQFPRVHLLDFVISLAIEMFFFICTLGLFLTLGNRNLESMNFIKLTNLLPLLIINLTAGPLGEELGWRGYALNEFQKKYNPLVSSIYIGIIWGFWHLPLWLLSGLTGGNLLVYSACFLIGIISQSVLITYFYNRSKNILIAVWIHFLFNFLLSLLVIDLMPFFVYAFITYFALTVCVVFINRKTMLQKPDTMIA
jgi:membrane protease YdiL (CAAX protease family)